MPRVTTFIALLRAVNVGGTAKLPMADLRAMGEAAGFRAVRSFIASGNLVFESDGTEGEVRAELEGRLRAYAGRPIPILVRSGPEMADVVRRNPFADRAPSRTVAFFLDVPPPPDALDHVTGRADEELALGRREIYVHYGDGMGTSRLKIPAAKAGTARNMNTVAKLAAMAGAG